MAASSVKSIATSIGITFGGVFLLGFIGLCVAGMVILSIISIYTPNTSVTPWGEQYRIQSMVLKAIISNGSYYFYNTTIVDSAALSTICTRVYQSRLLYSNNFQACVATNFLAFGPTNNTSPTSKRRKRQSNSLTVYQSGLYEIGELDFYYNSPCPTSGSIMQYISNVGSNSSCLARRINDCNRFIESGSANLWTPFPNGFTQLILNSSLSLVPVYVLALYNLNQNATANFGSLYNNTGIVYLRTSGCQYVRRLPQSNITTIIANQLSPNGTVLPVNNTNGTSG